MWVSRVRCLESATAIREGGKADCGCRVERGRLDAPPARARFTSTRLSFQRDYARQAWKTAASSPSSSRGRSGRPSRSAYEALKVVCARQDELRLRPFPEPVQWSHSARDPDIQSRPRHGGRRGRPCRGLRCRSCAPTSIHDRSNRRRHSLCRVVWPRIADPAGRRALRPPATGSSRPVPATADSTSS